MALCCDRRCVALALLALLAFSFVCGAALAAATAVDATASAMGAAIAAAAPLRDASAAAAELLRRHRGAFAIGDGDVGLVVPSTRHGAQPLSGDEHVAYVDAVAAMLVDLAGGCTATPGRGYYRMADGRLVAERVTTFNAAMLLASVAERRVAYDQLYRIAEWLADELDQEAVLLRLDRTTLLVPPSPPLARHQLWGA